MGQVGVEGRDRPQHLDLLVAHLAALEAGRRLHGHDREDLHHVVLDDVAQGAGLVVVAAARADAEVLGHGDLHVVDVAAVPDRLEDRVAEPQDQDVLDRLLPQVVVDAVDLPLAEDDVQAGVQLAGRLQVRAERLLDDQPGEALGVVRLLGQAGAAEVLGDDREELGGGGEVEEAVAARPQLGVEVLEVGAQAGVRVGVVEGDRDVAQAPREAVPDVLVDRDARVLLDRRPHALAELVVADVRAGRAHDRRLGRQQLLGGQAVEGREQLALGQIAGGAEDHDRGGGGRPHQADVLLQGGDLDGAHRRT